MTNFEKLQNGSDIRGIAMEGIENEHINLTPKIIATIAYSYVRYIQEKTNKKNIKIAIGRDSRLSGKELAHAFIYGVQEAGAEAIYFNMATTPAMFMCTVDKKMKIDASVMITASHLPFNRNGLKFFTKKGGAEKQDIKNILTLASKITDLKWPSSTNIEIKTCDYMLTYSNHLIEYIRKSVNDTTNYNEPLKGLHLIVDAGNGAGGYFADKVLQPLGAKTTGSQFLDPDGDFPNHVPNPENPQAMESICDTVKRNKADLGIIFDTDVDRSALVDNKGEAINRNTLIALIAAVILKKHPNSTIVTDSITSEGLSNFITHNLKGIHHRYKRGYRNVINEGIRLNKIGQECYLAIETSGHAALKENYFLDDGAFLIARLLIEAAILNKRGKNLHSLIKELSQPKENKEIRYKISDPNFTELGLKILKELETEMQTFDPNWEIVNPNYEGIRVKCNNPNEKGWFLLRMSLHDPVMPLNIESNTIGGVKIIESRLTKVLSKYELTIK